MKFTQVAGWGRARAGLLENSRAKVETPLFMPVGTRGSVKAVTVDQLEQMGAGIVLGNTYHLYLRPGDELIAHQGGLHQFSKWPGLMLTDSGGFQVSSLGNFNLRGGIVNPVKKPEITEEGVTFYSHLDGSRHFFDAKKSIQIQANLGADIIMAFDEATPDMGEEYAIKAMERTHRWLDESIAAWQGTNSNKVSDSKQALFGIIQGGDYPDLRRISAQFVVSRDLPGIAVGGGSIGADRLKTSQNVGWIYDLLPRDKPLYLMGVGVAPEDAISAVLDGADMFDCVAPTRQARTGILYHGHLTENKPRESEYVVEFETSPKLYYSSSFRRGKIHIGNSVFRQDGDPLSTHCGCYTCTKGYSRAYLRHLFISGELLFYQLASIHNLHTMIHTVKQLRQMIVNYSS